MQKKIWMNTKVTEIFTNCNIWETSSVCNGGEVLGYGKRGLQTADWLIPASGSSGNGTNDRNSIPKTQHWSQSNPSQSQNATKSNLIQSMPCSISEQTLITVISQIWHKADPKSTSTKNFSSESLRLMTVSPWVSSAVFKPQHHCGLNFLFLWGPSTDNTTTAMLQRNPKPNLSNLKEMIRLFQFYK